MLRSTAIQNTLLLIFSFFMLEVLSSSTLALILLGVTLSSLKVKPSKLIRNSLALGIFVSYWLIYGKLIDPEIGLNFLTSIIVLKILEKDSRRDHYMIFFGLLLLISAGSLFEKTLTYMLFFSVSFIVLLMDFYTFLGQRLKPKDTGYLVFSILPLTFALFFFVPRMMSPIALGQLQKSEGEVGYTPEVSVSEIGSLTSNTEPVFQAIVSDPVSPGDLYWRGNTVSGNDGWNWYLLNFDRDDGEPVSQRPESSGEPTQVIRLSERAEFYFALEVPGLFIVGDQVQRFNESKTLPQKRWNWTPRYQVRSQAPLLKGPEVEHKRNLQLQLSKSSKTWINETFKSRTLPQLQQEIFWYFTSQKFTYSLSPGKSKDFEEFMKVKKIGFCSHYASSLALILRAKGIPSRLVSGFLGGTYNRYGDFFLISQNDAHVWVEAYWDGNWNRLDPTTWIAPDRLRLGAQAYHQNLASSGLFNKSGFFRMPSFVLEMRQWFNQWDFSFYQWIEQLDYHTQETWFSKLKLKRQWIFWVLPLIMVAFMGLYTWFLSSKNKRISESEMKKAWRLFYLKLGKQGVILSSRSLVDAESQIREMNHPMQSEYLEIWNELVVAGFGPQPCEIDTLKKRIKKI